MEGRHVLIAGFGIPMGEALADRILKDGGIPVIVSRNENKLRQFVSTRGKGMYLAADLLSDSGIKSLKDFLKTNRINLFGLSILLGGYFTDRIDAPGDSISLLNSNIVAPIRLVSQLLEYMDNPSSVVLASSYVTLAPKTANPLSYTVSKYALNGLVENMAAQLLSRNIRMNAVAISAIGGRKGTESESGSDETSADDIAEVMEFLLSENSSLVNGAIIPVDRGLRFR